MNISNKILRKNEKILALLLTLIILIVGFVMLIIFMERKNHNNTKVDRLYFENISERKEVGRLVEINEKKDNVYLNIKYPIIGDKDIDEKISNIVLEKKDSISENYKSNGDNNYYFMDYEVYIGNGDIISFVLKSSVENDKFVTLDTDRKIYYFNLRDGKEVSEDDLFKEGFKDKVLSSIDKEVKDFNFVIKGDLLILLDEDVEVSLDSIKDYVKFDMDKSNDYRNTIKDKVGDIVNKDMMLLQDVVVHKKDSIDGEKITTLVKGDKVKVHLNFSNGFSMIYYNDEVGYIESKYLTDIVEEKPKPPVVPPITVVDTDRKTLYVNDNITVRSSASASSAKLGSLSYGDTVVQTGYCGEWIRIDYNGKEGFIKKKFTQEEEVIRHTIDVDVPPQSNIDPKKPMVAISFDDGPNNSSTVRILDTLEKYNVRATFFDLGNLMLRYPDVVKREARLGEVGTHTYSHKNLSKLDEAQIKEEIRLAKDAYFQVLGTYPKLMRPPYGSANALVKQSIDDMAIINWNVDSLDWKYRNKDLTLNEIYKYGNLDGKIILLHSIHSATADAFEILVPELLNRGYQIVTVSELAKYKGHTLSTGTIYYGFE